MTGACEARSTWACPRSRSPSTWTSPAGARRPGRAAGLEPRHRSRIAPLDITGYLAAIEDCRQRFPDLRILSGIECGEPHLFAASAAAVAGAHHFDRILGSLHAVPVRGRLAGAPALFGTFGPDEVMRRYFTELLRLVRGSDLFQVLAHLDFARRYWPPSAGPYEEKVFEDEYRAVLRALAESDRALEVNTKSPLASVGLLGCGGTKAAARCRSAATPTRTGGSATGSTWRWTWWKRRASARDGTGTTSGAGKSR